MGWVSISDADIYMWKCAQWIMMIYFAEAGMKPQVATSITMTLASQTDDTIHIPRISTYAPSIMALCYVAVSHMIDLPVRFCLVKPPNLH